MQIEPVITSIEAAVSTQVALAGGDPSVETAAAALMAALEPALRQAGMALAEQAASEVSAQLPDRRVEVVVVDGEPNLRVVASEGDSATAEREEDFDARITLRLPPSLKNLVEEAAGDAGDSINAWVVKALSSRARTSHRPGRRVTGSFDL